MTQNRFFTTRMVGPEYSPRYVIRDKRHSQQVFWNGVKWTRNAAKAMLFADMTEVWGVMYQLTLALFKKKYPRRTFRFHVDVTVYGDVSQEQVEQYLSDAMKLKIDYDRQGTGPTDESFVVLEIPNQQLLPLLA